MSQDAGTVPTSGDPAEPWFDPDHPVDPDAGTHPPSS